MTRAALIEMAIARMDELQPFDAALVVSTGNALAKPAKSYAQQCINEAINDVLKVCAIRFIKSVPGSTKSQDNFLGGYPTIIIPSDFLRIITINFLIYNINVDVLTGHELEIHAEGSPVHIQQKYPYTAATTEKPVAVLFSANYIQVYPVSVSVNNPNFPTIRMTYVPKVVGEAWTTDTICHDDLLPAIAWQCAGKALAIMGDARAANCFELAKAQLN